MPFIPSVSSRLTVPEIAADLRIGRLKVYEMLTRNIIPGIRVGRTWIVTRYAYEQWKANCGTQKPIPSSGKRISAAPLDRFSIEAVCLGFAGWLPCGPRFFFVGLVFLAVASIRLRLRYFRRRRILFRFGCGVQLVSPDRVAVVTIHRSDGGNSKANLAGLVLPHQADTGSWQLADRVPVFYVPDKMPPILRCRADDDPGAQREERS
jgi:excisionase family DNA binding protein